MGGGDGICGIGGGDGMAGGDGMSGTGGGDGTSMTVLVPLPGATGDDVAAGEVDTDTDVLTDVLVLVFSSDLL